VADFDGDGWQDIYFVNGRDLYDRGITVRNALYHNLGDGTFVDVTDKARVPGTGTDWAAFGAITTMTASPISTSRSSVATSYITTTGMGHLPMSPTKPA
jgi:hypothetical protein